jgi:hypothetical protein
MSVATNYSSSQSFHRVLRRRDQESRDGMDDPQQAVDLEPFQFGFPLLQAAKQRFFRVLRRHGQERVESCAAARRWPTART